MKVHITEKSRTVVAADTRRQGGGLVREAETGCHSNLVLSTLIVSRNSTTQLGKYCIRGHLSARAASSDSGDILLGF